MLYAATDPRRIRFFEFLLAHILKGIAILRVGQERQFDLPLDDILRLASTSEHFLYDLGFERVPAVLPKNESLWRHSTSGTLILCRSEGAVQVSPDFFK